MPGLSKVMLIGNIASDLTIKDVSETFKICSFSILVKTSNTKGERSDYFDVDVWGKAGEECSRSMSKGDIVLIDGSLRQEKWKDQQGNTRAKVKVVASNVQLLLGQMGDEMGGGSDSNPPF